MKRGGRLRRKARLRALSAATRRRLPLVRIWAVGVKTRDGRCQNPGCGATQDLEAHHVYPRRRYPDLRTVPENGLTLCRECHRAWHRASRAWLEWWKLTWPERAAYLLARLTD